MPLGVRRRYEAVFTANVVQRRRAERRDTGAGEKPALLSPGEARGRRAVGWRGLSVDLITGDEVGSAPGLPSDAANEVVGAEREARRRDRAPNMAPLGGGKRGARGDLVRCDTYMCC